MARPKKTATIPKTPKAQKTTRKRRDLAERIKTFDTAKIMALKATAEQTIRLVAAEGQRRQADFAAMQDTTLLDSLNGTTTKAISPNVVVSTPYAAPNGRPSTTSP